MDINNVSTERSPIPLLCGYGPKDWGAPEEYAKMFFEFRNGICYYGSYEEAPRVYTDFDLTFESLAPFVVEILDKVAPIEARELTIVNISICKNVVSVYYECKYEIKKEDKTMGSCGGNCECGKTCWHSDDFCENHICFSCRKKQKEYEAANPETPPIRIESKILITAQEAKKKAEIKIDKKVKEAFVLINADIQRTIDSGGFSVNTLSIEDKELADRIKEILESPEYGYKCKMTSSIFEDDYSKFDYSKIEKFTFCISWE
jgi:hypothetical protein